MSYSYTALQINLRQDLSSIKELNRTLLKSWTSAGGDDVLYSGCEGSFSTNRLKNNTDKWTEWSKMEPMTKDSWSITIPLFTQNHIFKSYTS